ncbi:MAG TPA: TA system VapC family ribonuclease toxin [Acidobacteriaceae bacterium]|jgi:toxin-antitoxin system PIN domain toxin
MTLYFPDVNVWVALSVVDHSHNAVVWKWLRSLPEDVRLVFSRYTQLGILRLLANAAVTGTQPLTLREAWDVYDQWSEDPRVDFYPEPRNVDSAFRKTSEPFAGKPASKWVGDCWLLAFAEEAGATLVTFDRALLEFARKQGLAAMMPR